jgi:hypothetical protein
VQHLDLELGVLHRPDVPAGPAAAPTGEWWPQHHPSPNPLWGAAQARHRDVASRVPEIEAVARRGLGMALSRCSTRSGRQRVDLLPQSPALRLHNA